MDGLHADLSDKILGAFYDVYNELGYDFLEKVFQNASFIELTARGFIVEAQKTIKVLYKGQEVGHYIADLVIIDVIILELKAAEVIVPEFEAQLLNYLRTSDIELGLLLNFGKIPTVKRKIYQNYRKI